MTSIQKKLFELKDDKYRDFTAKLIPNIDKETIIGVRSPQLRKYAKELYKEGNFDKFLNTLPHKYHEENMIHTLLIEQIKDYEECINKLDAFLPYINNWAVCDTFSPKSFKKNHDTLINDVMRWIDSEDDYTIRFGIGVLMSHFLNDDFRSEYLELPIKIKSDEYYVNMMIAWYFATALAKQWDYAVKVIEDKRLSPWVHNKTIQKARESFRVTDEHKEYLKTLKV